MRLYDYLPSGNGYKVRLLLHQLGHGFELVEVDIEKDETRTAAYLEKNPNGKIPLLELPDGTLLSESDAILFYLADGTPYLPADRLDRARVLQWMFFEQYSHEPNIAVARFWHMHGEMTADKQAALPQKLDQGYAALKVMQDRLAGHPYLVADRYSIADVALYAYTHVAHEGGFDLAPYPAVRGWLDRVAAQPGHVTIDHR